MKAYVDPDLCTGCGLCAESCPEVFRMEEDDVAVAYVDIVPSGAEADSQAAADDCPAEAISIE